MVEIFPYLLEGSQLFLIEVVCRSKWFPVEVIFEDVVDSFGGTGPSFGEVVEEEVIKVGWLEFS